MTDDRKPKQYCGAPTRTGGTCRHSTMLSEVNGLCLVHDPDRVEAWQAHAKRGQQRSVEARAENRKRDLALIADTAGPRPPIGNSAEEHLDWLRWVGEAAIRGELDQETLKALTAHGRVLQSAFKVRDYERQLRAALKRVKQLEVEAAACERRGGR